MIDPPQPRYKGPMRNLSALIPLFAALYHESVRASVDSGNTLANAERQARPFTEYGRVTDEVRRGREMTAERLLEQFEFTSRDRSAATGARAIPETLVNALAVSIHAAERDAVEAGLVAVKLNPPRPWTSFEQLPPQAQAGRKLQARWFLERFDVQRVGEARPTATGQPSAPVLDGEGHPVKPPIAGPTPPADGAPAPSAAELAASSNAPPPTPRRS